MEGGEVFLLANHGLPWRWRESGDICGGSWWKKMEGWRRNWKLVEVWRKLRVEGKGKKEKGKENKKGRYFGGVLEKLGEA